MSVGGNGAGDVVRPWELLRVDRDASADDVRVAFRRLSRHAHADAGGTGGLYRALVDARDAMLNGGVRPLTNRRLRMRRRLDDPPAPTAAVAPPTTARVAPPTTGRVVGGVPTRSGSSTDK
jgi:hypothetical protein